MANYTTAAGVQQFSITIASGSTTGTATINAVGVGAFILFGGINPSVANDPAEGYAYLALTNSTTITATRTTGTTGTVVVTGSIVDGDTTNLIKSVQIGTISLSTAQTTNTLSISSVTNTNTAVHLLGWASANTTISDMHEGPILSLSGTTLTVTRPASTGALTVGYEIIEFQGAALNQNVQNIAATSSASATSYSVTGLSSVNVSNAICIYGGSSIGTVTTNQAEYKQRGVLASATSFTVSVNTAVADAKSYNCTLVEFNSGVLNSAVQRGTTTLTAVTSSTSTLSRINASYSAISWLGNTTTVTAADANEAEGLVTLFVNPITHTSFSAANSGAPASSLTVSSISGVISGTALVVSIAAQNSANSVISVVDSAGQNYIQCPGSAASDSTSNVITDIWYFPNSVAGVTSLTVTISAASSAFAVDCFVIQNAALSSLFDVGGNVTNGVLSTSQLSAPLTTTQAGDIIIVNDINNSGGVSAVAAPYTFYGFNSLSAYYVTSGIVTASQCTFTPFGNTTYSSSAAAFFSGNSASLKVTKNSATGNITGSWEVFEFPAYVSPVSNIIINVGQWFGL